MAKTISAGNMAMTYSAATRGQTDPPMPPVALTMHHRQRLRCLASFIRVLRQQILAPGRHEVDDDDHDDAVLAPAAT